MDEKPIKEIASLKKLRGDAENFSIFKKAWPYMRPFVKIFGVDVNKIDEALKKVDSLVENTIELTSLPDEFNQLFAEKGWIMYDRMNIDLAKKTIELGKSGKYDEAERILVEHYTFEELQREIMPMRIIDAFAKRIPLAEKALVDFKEQRYYSSVLVVLSLLDGMVNEIQHKGFFSKDVDLTAWDSIAAHSKGLQKLVLVMSQSRTKTVVETIHIPYRHGIIHGMDLGYDNKEVAIKAWVALFATSDWALKAERNQLQAPPEKPEPTWEEILDQIQQNAADEKALKNWKPRNRIIGASIPYCGQVGDYEDNSPEQKLVEFLQYWKSNNYGFMAKCIFNLVGDDIKDDPRRIREEYIGRRLKTWRLMEVFDETPAVTIISLSVTYEENDITRSDVWQVRMILHDDNNIVFYRGKLGSRWSLVSWHLTVSQ